MRTRYEKWFLVQKDQVVAANGNADKDILKIFTQKKNEQALHKICWFKERIRILASFRETFFLIINICSMKI